MPRHRRLGQGKRIHPHVVTSAVVMKKAAVCTQMAFQNAAIHGKFFEERSNR